MELYRVSYTTVTVRVALSFLTFWLHKDLLREVRRILCLKLVLLRVYVGSTEFI